MKTYPVVEIFGPTVQGEGEHQGVPCHFVRFGGCDYKCDWCDTPHAVLPQAVRAAERLGTVEIVERVNDLAGWPGWVVVSGGNPLLHDLEELVDSLRLNDYKVSVETQGTRWKDWVTDCDSICVSPKPPSSQMDMRKTEDSLAVFFTNLNGHPAFLKIVVFDQRDLEWAKKIHREYFFAPMFLSAGNDAGKTVGNPTRADLRSPEQVATDLLARARWLTNHVMVDPNLRDVRVQAQYHTLLWGNELGH